MCQPVTVFLSARLNPCQYGISCKDATKRTASQRLTCTQVSILAIHNVFNAYANYEHTMSTAIHHIPNVSLQQQKVISCRALPLQTFRFSPLD